MPEKKLLFFNDSAELFNWCRKILEDGYRVAAAGFDGDAVESVDDLRPDLVLIDLASGGERGFDLCRRLTADDRTVDIPTMVICPAGDRGAADRALQAGAVDYVVKPVIPTLFAKRVQTAIERFASGMTRCPQCHRPLRPEWSFCPFDGSRSPQKQ